MMQYLELLISRMDDGRRRILVYGAGSQGRGVISALRERD